MVHKGDSKEREQLMCTRVLSVHKTVFNVNKVIKNQDCSHVHGIVAWLFTEKTAETQEIIAIVNSVNKLYIERKNIIPR